MLRNRSQDFAGYRQEYPGDWRPPVAAVPAANPMQLDPKDERLLELSQEVGKLYGINDLLQEDNVRLEADNKELTHEMKQLRERNLKLEQEASGDRQGFRKVAEIMDELEEELTKRKAQKKGSK